MTTDNTAAILEIMRLNARYNFSVDAADGPAWADCFTRDGVFYALLEGHTPKGADELSAFVPVLVEAFGTMHHLTTNEIIDVDGDTATQTCYLQFFVANKGLTQGSLCVYHDELAREDGAWKFVSRRVDFKRPFTTLTDDDAA